MRRAAARTLSSGEAVANMRLHSRPAVMVASRLNEGKGAYITDINVVWPA
jgi:hypothetical protein